MTAQRRIYVACLAAYNAGILYGKWIDCEDKDAFEIQEEVDEMLKGSPCPGAEEWAIHDHEGFGGLLGEHDSFERVAELNEALNEHGDALLAFLEAFGRDADIEKFSEAYRGQWDSPEAFAEDWAIEADVIRPDHPLYSYVDWAHYWNADLRHSFTEHDGHFFWSDF
ncbi:antirestriction protein ArdA [Burkholderia multivorans]|uniref:antirestriction protein ArdA n=1 Tax=Burkholderia multivorans TaxID=87883 RepID=UPI001B9C4B68|nr:antirestriction protein ArdA [Burkholderia multivorans]MBR8020790.1 antirestriction protein ArdA [Burkholderia multivorans]MBU9227283.1 antirestriction protein ArdA [Burkholderia multivorans]MBU9388478.1 antirestriction protein ArdA [Burkholderia multivorans]MDN8031160.1 antirestriction protein ArdA [Burkholderia multivorans]HEF4732917.1 antirestriction protein ArdA [Burkholderia multivorans]